MASQSEILSILPHDPAQAVDVKQMANLLDDPMGRTNYSRRLSSLKKAKQVTYRDICENHHARRIWWRL
jgi:hypothetical protein